MDQFDILALKAHVDDGGHVWQTVADGLPVCTGMSTIQYLMQTYVQNHPRIRVVGVKQNVELIIGLFGQRYRGGNLLEVASPSVCSPRTYRHNPISVLTAARMVTLSPTNGGWHAFGLGDYASYGIAYLLQKYGQVDDHARRLLKAHVAWPALSFIPHLDTDACAQLLAEILDPRFYLTNQHPARSSKLRAYLGLEYTTLEGVLAGRTTTSRARRCKLVLDAWRKQLTKPDVPGAFLHRVFLDKAAKGTVKGLLRASQLFVDFLRLVWLAALAKQQSENVFEASCFFHDEIDVAHFKHHLSKQTL